MFSSGNHHDGKESQRLIDARAITTDYGDATLDIQSSGGLIHMRKKTVEEQEQVSRARAEELSVLYELNESKETKLNKMVIVKHQVTGCPTVKGSSMTPQEATAKYAKQKADRKARKAREKKEMIENKGVEQRMVAGKPMNKVGRKVIAPMPSCDKPTRVGHNHQVTGSPTVKGSSLTPQEATAKFAKLEADRKTREMKEQIEKEGLEQREGAVKQKNKVRRNVMASVSSCDKPARVGHNHQVTGSPSVKASLMTPQQAAAKFAKQEADRKTREVREMIEKGELEHQKVSVKQKNEVRRKVISSVSSFQKSTRVGHNDENVLPYTVGNELVLA
jgi:hypothetical protein